MTLKIPYSPNHSTPGGVSMIGNIGGPHPLKMHKDSFFFSNLLFEFAVGREGTVGDLPHESTKREGESVCCTELNFNYTNSQIFFFGYLIFLRFRRIGWL